MAGFLLGTDPTLRQTRTPTRQILTDGVGFTANSSTTITLTNDPGTEDHVVISFDGIVQHHSTYTVSATTVTFDAVIPTGVAEIEASFVVTVSSITVPDGSVSTSKIVDANITEAKLQDKSVSLSKMASGTDGNIISFDASGNPVAIATGTDGQVLTSAGAGAQPAFEALPAGAGCWTLITETTASASAAVDFTLDNSTYQMFKIIITEARPSTEGSGESVIYRLSNDGGSTFVTAGYDFMCIRINETAGPTGLFGGAEAALQPHQGSASGQGNAGTELFSAEINITSSGDASSITFAGCPWSHFRDSVNVNYASTGTAWRTTAETNDAIRCYYSGGASVAEGNFKLYGQVK